MGESKLCYRSLLGRKGRREQEVRPSEKIILIVTTMYEGFMSELVLKVQLGKEGDQDQIITQIK